ncbi:MAG: hypothetical protein NVS1B2_00570 [Vulcanimicrobiaceae bacterium]
MVVGLQVVAMSIGAAAFGTWHDEEYTLATTALGPSYAFHRAIDFELQAPLYFVVLAALRTISHAVFFARLFSVACAVGAAYAMAAVSRRIAPGRPAWPLVALVACNPFTIFAALEIRLYAFALLLAVLCWLAFYDGYLAGDSVRARRTFVGLALISMYTQYFLAFEFVAFGIALLVARRTRFLGSYALAGVAVAIGFVPLAMVLHGQVNSAFGVPDAALPALVDVFVHPVVDFIIPVGYRIWGGTRDKVLELVLGLAFVGAIIVGRPRFSPRNLAFVAAAAVVEAIYATLADVLHYQLVVPRHFIALFVPEVIAAYAVVASFRGRFARPATIAIVVVVVASTLATDAWTYRAFAKLGDWPRVGAYLSERTAPGDVVAVTEADSLPAFERYYRGPARVVPFPRPLPPDRYDVDAMMIHSVAEGEAALARLPQGRRLWLVIYGACGPSDQLGCRELTRAIDARERVVERRAFFVNTVLRIEPRDPTR